MLALALSHVIGFLSLAPPPPRQLPPSVLVFVLDDVAAADLALYGGPVQTPYLSQLAAAGVKFTNAYAHAWCAPTRRSILFGQWWQNGSGGLCTALPGADTPPLFAVSLPEALPSFPSALIGKWHLGSSPAGGPWQQAPIEHGFDYWAAGVPGNIAADQPCGAPTDANYSKWLRVDTSAAGYRVTTSTTYHGLAVRDFFVASWRYAPKPALAVICSHLPHDPFHVPPASLLPSGYPRPVSGRQKYEAMIVALDKTIGQMLAHVDLAETLVIVIGDNGTPTHAAPPGQANRAKGSTFERGVRVPLIVAGGPTVNGGRVCADLVHAVDVYATAAKAGGGDIPSGSDSVSFTPVLEARSYTPRDFVFLGNRWLDAVALPCERAAVSATGFKLRQLDDDGNGTVDREELYDLLSDPSETSNIIASSTEDDELRAFLDARAP